MFGVRKIVIDSTTFYLVSEHNVATDCATLVNQLNEWGRNQFERVLRPHPTKMVRADGTVTDINN